MKVLIVEDETAAYENLVHILHDIDPRIEVVGNAESITQTVHWLSHNTPPDLILMDIHLSDGSAFAIFASMEVETPIIFTTAYDEYAIDAFKVNSVDYLLKPIKAEEMERALNKLARWTRTDVMQYLARMARLAPPVHYKEKMLIPLKDSLLPVDVNEVSCFYTTERTTRVYLKDGRSYPYAKTLEQIAASLNPHRFYRANKQFLVGRDSVTNITIWFDSRLLLTLDVEVPERIYISKNKAAEFKQWLVND